MQQCGRDHSGSIFPLRYGQPMSSFVSQSIGFAQTPIRQLKRSECLHASQVDSF